MQRQKEYNIFHTQGGVDLDHASVLQIDSIMNISESNMTPEYAYEATYAFLTETLGWNEGLEDREPISTNTNGQTWL